VFLFLAARLFFLRFRRKDFGPCRGTAPACYASPCEFSPAQSARRASLRVDLRHKTLPGFGAPHSEGFVAFVSGIPRPHPSAFRRLADLPSTEQICPVLLQYFLLNMLTVRPFHPFWSWRLVAPLIFYWPPCHVPSTVVSSSPLLPVFSGFYSNPTVLSFRIPVSSGLGLCSVRSGVMCAPATHVRPCPPRRPQAFPPSTRRALAPHSPSLCPSLLPLSRRALPHSILHSAPGFRRHPSLTFCGSFTFNLNLEVFFRPTA